MYDFQFDQACESLCGELQNILTQLPESYKKRVQEIRLRLSKPVVLTTPHGFFYITMEGRPVSVLCEGLLTANRNHIEDTVLSICEYSVHAHQHEIMDGFVTLKGGHRAGLCGTAVMKGGAVTSLRDISSINIRVASQKKDCAKEVFELLGKSRGGVILAGPPLSGKTTLLRDLAQKLSARKKICVVDERCEIGAVHNGVEQAVLGENCDVLNGYPKIVGIVHAVRGLSPDYIIVDEIGTEQEAETIKWGLNSGVRFVATVHAGDLEDIRQRKGIRSLLETGAFEHIVLLGGGEQVGEIQEIRKVSELLYETDVCHSHNSGGNGVGISQLVEA